MRPDFCAFILTHGRPDRVLTYNTLLRCGYTGKVFIVIDDEDKTADQYRERFGDIVLQFSKAQIAKTFDEGDNFGDRRAIVYARNACWDLARQVGCRYFIQLDDDYTGFFYRFTPQGEYKHLKFVSIDAPFEALVEFLEAAPRCHSIAMSQGGDHIGGERSGANKTINLRRKAMNTFVCSVDRPFQFVGRINEDVNTYTCGTRTGLLLFTFNGYQVSQMQTQHNAGGMTDLYLDSGTYIKTFYSVMYAPSCVKVYQLYDPRCAKDGKHNARIHHFINWNRTAPKILREDYKR